MRSRMFPEKRKNFIELIVGLVAIALLIFVKIQVEKSSYGHWFDVRGYEILHSFIPRYNPNKELPVVVLDVSDLTSGQNEMLPDKKLEEIIDALIQSKAKAIAIDFDYSVSSEPQNPSVSLAKEEENKRFFKILHEQNLKGVPIFVGTLNIGVEPKTWLGTTKDKDLAADITIDSENTTEIPAWLQCDENNNDTKLNSLSRALAEASGKSPQPPGWLKFFLKDYEEKSNLKLDVKEDKEGNKYNCQRAFTLVNYSKLELMQKLSLQTLSKESVFWAKNTDGKSKFENKLVIIGNGQLEKAKNNVTVIDHSVPRIFVHASATYTLVEDPVYKFKHWVGILLDILLGMFIVVGLFLVRLKYPDESHASAAHWENRFVVFSVITTLVLGFLLVKFYNVLWLDFLLVVFALFLHSKVQNGLIYIPNRFVKSPQKSIEKSESVDGEEL